jgi:tRNA (adenine22-N1)-methyltransferase
MRLNISTRLLTISTLVDKDAIIYDVGTDHALLPIYLAKNHQIIKEYATDLRSGPCKSALLNVEHFGVKEQIEVFQSKGLDDLKDDVTSIIIAGMGGNLINSILDSNLNKINEKHTLILQPNTAVKDVRSYLSQHGFMIIDEHIIFEDEHYYEIMKVIKKECHLTGNEILFGPVLMKKKSAIFINKYQQERDTYRNVLSKIAPTNSQRILEINEYIQRIEEIL